MDRRRRPHRRSSSCISSAATPSAYRGQLIHADGHVVREHVIQKHLLLGIKMWRNFRLGLVGTIFARERRHCVSDVCEDIDKIAPFASMIRCISSSCARPNPFSAKPSNSLVRFSGADYSVTRGESYCPRRGLSPPIARRGRCARRVSRLSSLFQDDNSLKSGSLM